MQTQLEDVVCPSCLQKNKEIVENILGVHPMSLQILSHGEFTHETTTSLSYKHMHTHEIFVHMKIAHQNSKIFTPLSGYLDSEASPRTAQNYASHRRHPRITGPLPPTTNRQRSQHTSIPCKYILPLFYMLLSLLGANPVTSLPKPHWAHTNCKLHLLSRKKAIVISCYLQLSVCVCLCAHVCVCASSFIPFEPPTEAWSEFGVKKISCW